MYPCEKANLVHSSDFVKQELSLSMIVLNSRDWSEIVWLPDFSHFIKQPSNKLDLKNSTQMHWYCYNDAVNLLNKAKC